MESGSIKCHGESRKIRTEVKLDLLRCKSLEGFPGGSEKESAYNAVAAGDMDSVPESGRSPRERKATHSSMLTWRIPWTEEPGRLQSIGLQRVRHD